MEYLKAFEYLSLSMFLLAVTGFILVADVLYKSTMGKETKIGYKIISISSLLLPICFFLVSKSVATSILYQSVSDLETIIKVEPNVKYESRRFLAEVLENLYTYKNKSGSRPTEEKFVIKMCKGGYCANLEVSQDSRDSDMYWVGYSFQHAPGLSLGYTKLRNEI